MLYKFLFFIGRVIRNPSLKSYHEFLKTSETWSKEELLKYQFDKCKSFLEFTYIYSPYYRKVFQEIGFLPNEMTSLEDIKKIPCMDKTELLNNTSSVHTTYSFKKIFHSETSGTTGQPLKFARNEEWDSHNRAAMFRGYSWHGIKVWDKNGYFWGYNLDKSAVVKTKLLDKLQNRFRLFSYNKNEILRFIKKLKYAKYLHGYSSMIYEVAKIVNKMNLDGKYNLKMIKGTSEKIYENYHNEVNKAFGLKIISEYGAAETGLIAFECEKGNMHINVENVIVEIEDGEIIVTNLLSKSFPIIRYKLGDKVTLSDPDFICSCGRNHPVIIDILGRVGKKIIGYQKKYPSLMFYYVFKNLAVNSNIVLNYQAVQNENGKVTLLIEQPDNDPSKLLQNELYKYFSDDIDFTVKYEQNFHVKEGKLKDFITSID